MSRPHALYIAWGFPPSRGSGVYRALATANGLVDAGFDVTVLTCDRVTFFRYTMADTTLEELVHPSIEIVRIPFDWPIMDRNIRRWDKKRARDPAAWTAARPLLDQEHYPEVHYGPWRDALVSAAQDIHRKKPVDVAVATANPNVDIEAAHQLYLAHGVPFVMDQRDAWTLNTFTEEPRDDSRVQALEAAYIRDAHEVWFVNEPLRDWHAERNPQSADRIKAVFNGFDHDVAPEPRLSPPPAEKPLTFGYLGTITRNTFLESFLAGWVRARDVDPELKAATAELWGYLGFFTGKTSISQVVEQYADRGVRYLGPVPKTEVRRRYADFDVLLLLLGTGRFVTSGKIFEYMASGLPIVSVHSDELDASRLLRDYPLWFQPSSQEPDSVAAALVEAAAAARSAGPEVRQKCVEYAQQYDRRRLLGPRLQALFNLVGGEAAS